MENSKITKKLDKKYYPEDGIMLVHKSLNISSFGLVARMRGVLNTRKIGHAGTLDPLATGLMILGIDRGTKKMNDYIGMDKVYLAEIIIGKSTTTGDSEGEIVAERYPISSDIRDLDMYGELLSLIGEAYYPAPLYSAVKVLGKPLYKYAREGTQPPFIPEKKMHLKSVQVLDLYKSESTYILKIRACVGSGTYIRTLAEEFGKKIGYPASLKSLYRVSIGPYQDKDAFRIDKLHSKQKNVIMEIYSLIKKSYEHIFPNKKR